MFGMVALVVAGREIVCTVIRRDLARSTLGLIGLALIAFNLTAMALIVFGRSDHFGTMPFELFAPRYFFHSTLFWMGLLLVAIHHAAATPWMRWPVYFVALAVSLLAVPSHYWAGIRRRQITHLSQAAATSLVNGVRDDRHRRHVRRDDVRRLEPDDVHRADRLDVVRLERVQCGGGDVHRQVRRFGELPPAFVARVLAVRVRQQRVQDVVRRRW